MIINELMEAKGITKYRLAKDSGIPYTTINDLRNMKLKDTIYPSSVLMASRITGNDALLEESEREAIPEFLRFNIVESEVRNVV